MRHSKNIIVIVLLMLSCSTANRKNKEFQEFEYLKSCNSTNSEVLFQDNSKINVKVDSGIPIISYFAKIGNLHCINKLLSLKADINSVDSRGFTPFIFSVYSNPKVMKLLLENGADISAETPNGGNALILAAEIGNLDALKFLIERGMNINHLTKHKGTPLMHAAIRGYSKIIEELLINGANPNLADNLNITPIMHAASNGHIETVTLLLKFKADVNIKDYKGYSVILAPSDASYPSENHLVIVDLLVNAGANINDRNNFGDSALSIAKKRKLFSLITKLESLGAKD
ncbi:ankyrin repeat domain-containing protein [Leptospira idonii]|uniref:Ankyrin repeat domain-containing protein n=1 Tax=Leptospira idonii TaxID=1193500 RepID=A0A4R9M2E8_9LEPT|nr:ankyrin repeat domain-containing protein [Leptospira idonii]TGN20045.1 ankyrin repeat domain-containing protein [Leptospira idonii]